MICPLFTEEGPAFYAAAYAHNRPFAVAGPYLTTLSAPAEVTYRAWVTALSIPTDPDENPSDYNMRGYWQANSGTGTTPAYSPGDHFPDTFKTPYDTSFSAESMYATANCPFTWAGDYLIDTRDGSWVFGECSDDPQGVCIASDDDWNVETPSWERIDRDYNVTGWAIDRGRNFELEKTRTGTATIDLIDRTGAFDPTNTGATFYPLGPLFQAAIALQDPVTWEWSTLFRGFISRIEWVPYIDLQHANVRLYLVDGLGVLAACEMAPDGTFGDSVEDGNIVFDEIDSTDAVQQRIGDGSTYGGVLSQAGWSTALRSIFTGNVKLQRVVYAPRTQVLTVVQDAADAEFPNVANFYMSKDGKATFHGRDARFFATDPTYGITTWKIGDHAAVVADSNYVPAAPPLVVALDDSSLYTSAIATPANVDDDDIAAQYVKDAAAVTAYGLRTWSAENLLTLGGTLTDALEETILFADYVKDNFAAAVPRVGTVTVKPRMPGTTAATKTWALMCGVDISDRVHLKTTHHGGGGFDTLFYVEGVHYTARPGNATIPIVELSLDLSPASFYDSNPFT